MALTRLLNLLALSSLAVVLFSSATPSNALTSDAHLARRGLPHYALAAKRKRQSTSRCKVSSVNSAALNTTQPQPTPENVGGSGDPTTTTTTSGGSSDYNSGNTDDSSGSNNNGSGGGSPSSSYSPSSSSSYSPSPSSPPTSSSSSFTVPSPPNRMGLGWPNGNDPVISNFKSNFVNYVYTWSPSKPETADQLGLTFMPMLWGGTEDRISDFTQNRPLDAQIVMGFNECNEPGQSNLSPQDAAALWQQLLQPIKAQNPSVYMIGPSTSSNPNGFQWTKDFFAACTGCQIDGLSLHYYDVSSDGFIAYLNEFHDGFGLPVWVTEYDCQNFNGGAQCSSDETYAFHKAAVAFMDSVDWVQGYFPFGAMHDMAGVNPTNQLMNPDGSLTSLGQNYVDHNWP